MDAKTADFVRTVLTGGRGQDLVHTINMALYGVWGLFRAIEERPNIDQLIYGSGPGGGDYFGPYVWDAIYSPAVGSAEDRMWSRLQISEASSLMEDDQRYLKHPVGWAGDREYIGFHMMRTVMGAASECLGYDDDYSDSDLRSYCASFFEALLDVVSDLDEAAAAEQSTGHGVAHLLAGIASQSGAVGLVDIACGFGNALKEAILAGAHGVRGADVDDRLLAIAEMRAEVHGMTGDFAKVSAFDAREKGYQNGTGIVLDPPLETSISAVVPSVDTGGLSDDSLWLRAAWDLAPRGGRAVVVLSRESLELGRIGNEFLTGLVAGGSVRGLIVLPASARSNGAAPTVIWVLKRAVAGTEAASGILVVDARVLVSEDQLADGDVTVASSRAIIASINAWVEREEFDLPVRAAHIVRISELSGPTRTIPLPRQMEYDGERGLADPTNGRLLTSLSLENFKSFEAGIAVLRPLTLIFGPNSAGKSTMIQSLLLLKESLHAGRVTTRGEQVDLGSFDSVVHSHDTTRRVGVKVSFRPSPDAPIRTFSPSPLAGREFRFSFESQVPGRISWTHMTVGTDRNSVKFIGPASSRKLPIVESGNLTNFFETHAPLDPLMADVVEAFVPGAANRAETRQSLPRPFDHDRWNLLRNSVLEAMPFQDLSSIAAEFSGLKPTGMWKDVPHDSGWTDALIEPMRAMLGVTAAVADELEQLFERLTYLGPVRPAPQRLYSLGPASDDALAAQLLILSEQPHALRRVNEWLTRLGLRYQIAIERFVNRGGASTDVLGLSLIDPRSDLQLSTTDVGYGVSQIVPLVMGLTTSRNAVVCIEQPELHLHPGLQAELGDLLIDSVRELGRGNQIIAETHSEHLMLRVQRRIREGLIDAEDVSVLYVDQNSAGESRVQRLRLDSVGAFIDEWPSGFFEERYDEVFGADL
ncbi:AAA family ATPase [Cryobacterium sp. Hh38]|uniref:AAA family ATPase n=1 Tax=Cryobacterium sp. Hh38 TaxID=1259156 RepID=UPI00141B1DEC|nr:AAA family ATPase [Cryobacterium sp. Hh38]